MGIFNPHPGSWLRMPDYGITEAIGGLLGRPRTPQGGSNVISSQPRSPSSAQVLGSTAPAPYSQPMSSPANYSSPVSGGTLSQPQPQQQQQGNPFQDMGQSTFDQAQAELNSALSDYDRLDAQLGQDVISATGQKESALSGVDTQVGKARTQAATSKKEAEEGTLSQTEGARSTAQDVERKNRNMLRALGILSSSAAGEMLGKPWEEFNKTSGDLRIQLEKRKGQIDTWLNDRLGEADTVKNDIIRQFNDIVAKINVDRRFNQRDKIDAIRSAQAALSQNIAQLNQQAMAYQQAAQQYTQGMMSQVAQLQLYQNPQANISGILSQMMNQQPQAYKPVQVGTLQPRREDELLSNF